MPCRAASSLILKQHHVCHLDRSKREGEKKEKNKERKEKK